MTLDENLDLEREFDELAELEIKLKQVSGVDLEGLKQQIYESGIDHYAIQLKSMLIDNLLELTKHEEDGVSSYKTSFTTEEAKELANKLYNKIIAYVAKEIIVMKPEEIEKIDELVETDARGFLDGATISHTGVDREEFKDLLVENRTNIYEVIINMKITKTKKKKQTVSEDLKSKNITILRSRPRPNYSDEELERLETQRSRYENMLAEGVDNPAVIHRQLGEIYDTLGHTEQANKEKLLARKKPEK
ncbi:hypothetical protein HQ533_05590 [Candidatus Woesearchaeota archaeon]|nr:hypothetical protein [Candidatus Woesearchaeota archaeon]